MKCLVLSMSQGSGTSLCFRAGSQTSVLHKKNVDLLDQIQRDGKEGWKGRMKENWDLHVHRVRPERTELTELVKGPMRWAGCAHSVQSGTNSAKTLQLQIHVRLSLFSGHLKMHHRTTEMQNGLKGTLKPIPFHSLLCAGTPSTVPGCPKPCPTWLEHLRAFSQWNIGFAVPLL